MVEYSFLQDLNGRNVYNLGFGDYDLQNDSVIDDINTNNGDAYKVFNTVINTIPQFFNIYSNAILMVQGSDSRPEFKEICKLSCKKKCQHECKNFKRRITIYRRYVELHFKQLTETFHLWGAKKSIENTFIIEAYTNGKEFDAIFLFKKQ